MSHEVLVSGLDYQRLLRRHLAGDWGDICDYDAQENSLALAANKAVISQFRVTMADGQSAMMCIMTEERQVYTVVFFPN